MPLVDTGRRLGCVRLARPLGPAQTRWSRPGSRSRPAPTSKHCEFRRRTPKCAACPGATPDWVAFDDRMVGRKYGSRNGQVHTVRSRRLARRYGPMPALMPVARAKGPTARIATTLWVVSSTAAETVATIHDSARPALVMSGGWRGQASQRPGGLERRDQRHQQQRKHRDPHAALETVDDHAARGEASRLETHQLIGLQSTPESSRARWPRPPPRSATRPGGASSAAVRSP